MDDETDGRNGAGPTRASRPARARTDRGPTIFDVAAASGVSHQTVSRVINGDPTVRDHIRASVVDAVRSLGYRPRAAARALAGGTTRALGLISTGGALYGPTSTALGFNQAARRVGYHVLTATLDESDPTSMQDAVSTLLMQDVAAIVLVAADSRALDALEQVRNLVSTPIVIANARADRIPGAHTVAIDQGAGAELVVAHLLASGHRRIASLTGPSVSQEAVARGVATVAALGRAGTPLVDVVEGDWTPASGYAFGASLDVAHLDALICGNDQMALGVLHAFADRGVRVPDDLALVGFDDIPEAAHFTPPLTTVRQDFATLGQHVLGAVDGVLAGRPVDSDAVIAPTLVVRSSAP